jgi:hypothetical protein
VHVFVFVISLGSILLQRLMVVTACYTRRKRQGLCKKTTLELLHQNGKGRSFGSEIRYAKAFHRCYWHLLVL